MRVRGGDDMPTMYTKSSKNQLLTDLLGVSAGRFTGPCKPKAIFMHLINSGGSAAPALVRGGK